MPMVQQSALIGVAAGVGSAFLGGTAAVGLRYLVSEVDPLTAALMRYGLAALLLCLVAFARRNFRLSRRDALPIAAFGAIMFTIFPILFATAFVYTTAGRGALALSTMPVLTLIIARLLVGEKLTARKSLGVGCALLGVCIALAGDLSGAAADAWKGDLIMLGAAVCGATFSVTSRRYIIRHEPMAFTVQSAISGTVLLLALMAVRGQLTQVPELTTTGWLVVLYVGGIGGALSFFLWTYALRRTLATNVAVAVAVNPLAAMLFGALLLDEALTSTLLLGFACVATGITIVSTTRRIPVIPPAEATPVTSAPAAISASQTRPR